MCGTPLYTRGEGCYTEEGGEFILDQVNVGTTVPGLLDQCGHFHVAFKDQSLFVLGLVPVPVSTLVWLSVKEP